MTNRDKYQALAAELRAVETNPELVAKYATARDCGRLYLTDENVDRENVGPSDDSDDFWGAMVSAACYAAGSRAEGYGFDINAALGRVIY